MTDKMRPTRKFALMQGPEAGQHTAGWEHTGARQAVRLWVCKALGIQPQPYHLLRDGAQLIHPTYKYKMSPNLPGLSSGKYLWKGARTPAMRKVGACTSLRRHMTLADGRVLDIVMQLAELSSGRLSFRLSGTGTTFKAQHTQDEAWSAARSSNTWRRRNRRLAMLAARKAAETMISSTCAAKSH